MLLRCDADGDDDDGVLFEDDDVVSSVMVDSKGWGCVWGKFPVAAAAGFPGGQSLGAGSENPLYFGSDADLGTESGAGLPLVRRVPGVLVWARVFVRVRARVVAPGVLRMPV